MWINYQQLLYFRQIAKDGSISAASASLKISGPALSMQLKSLEETLGQQLFLRDKNRLLITDFGKYVLEYAERIFSMGEELLSNINNDFVRTRVSIGVNSGVPKTITNRLIRYLAKSYPECVIQFTEGDDSKLVKDLVSRECDLIISNSFLSDPNNSIQTKFVYESQLSFYGTSVFDYVKKDFPKALDKTRIILPTLHSNLRDIIDEWYFENKLKYVSLMEIHDSAVKKIMASESYGVIVLSKIGAERLLNNKEVIHLGDIDRKEHFYCATRSYDQNPKDPIQDVVVNFKTIIEKNKTN